MTTRLFVKFHENTYISKVSSKQEKGSSLCSWHKIYLFLLWGYEKNSNKLIRLCIVQNSKCARLFPTTNDIFVHAACHAYIYILLKLYGYIWVCCWWCYVMFKLTTTITGFFSYTTATSSSALFYILAYLHPIFCSFVSV